jgi:hypothetical protein
MASEIKVERISTEDAKPWLLERHYARRLCPISHAFGAFVGSTLIGVVTYGCPSSSPLRKGICGNEWSSNVLELNRLCCESRKNLASTLVGRSLALLPKPSIVVSYADTGQGHIGFVYQATNFIYTGLSAKGTDWKIKGMEHLHGQTIADMSKGKENRAQFMRDKFGDDFYLNERDRKHRYIFFCGNKRQSQAMKAALKYKVEPYPKGESKRYDASAVINNQGFLFI